MKKTVITFDSVTNAIRAKKSLSTIGIKARLVKIDPTLTARGCTHGIEINYSLFLDAVNLLRNKNIEYSVING